MRFGSRAASLCIATAIFVGMVGVDIGSAHAAPGSSSSRESAETAATYHQFQIGLDSKSNFAVSYAFMTSEDKARGAVKVAPSNGAVLPPGTRGTVAPAASTPKYGFVSLGSHGSGADWNPYVFLVVDRVDFPEQRGVFKIEQDLKNKDAAPRIVQQQGSGHLSVEFTRSTKNANGSYTWQFSIIDFDKQPRHSTAMTVRYISNPDVYGIPTCEASRMMSASQVEHIVYLQTPSGTIENRVKSDGNRRVLYLYPPLPETTVCSPASVVEAKDRDATPLTGTRLTAVSLSDQVFRFSIQAAQNMTQTPGWLPYEVMVEPYRVEVDRGDGVWEGYGILLPQEAPIVEGNSYRPGAASFYLQPSAEYPISRVRYAWRDWTSPVVSLMDLPEPSEPGLNTPTSVAISTTTIPGAAVSMPGNGTVQERLRVTLNGTNVPDEAYRYVYFTDAQNRLITGLEDPKGTTTVTPIRGPHQNSIGAATANQDIYFSTTRRTSIEVKARYQAGGRNWTAAVPARVVGTPPIVHAGGSAVSGVVLQCGQGLAVCRAGNPETGPVTYRAETSDGTPMQVRVNSYTFLAPDNVFPLARTEMINKVTLRHNNTNGSLFLTLDDLNKAQMPTLLSLLVSEWGSPVLTPKLPTG